MPRAREFFLQSHSLSFSFSLFSLSLFYLSYISLSLSLNLSPHLLSFSHPLPLFPLLPLLRHLSRTVLFSLARISVIECNAANKETHRQEQIEEAEERVQLVFKRARSIDGHNLDLIDHCCTLPRKRREGGEGREKGGNGREKEGREGR